MIWKVVLDTPSIEPFNILYILAGTKAAYLIEVNVI